MELEKSIVETSPDPYTLSLVARLREKEAELESLKTRLAQLESSKASIERDKQSLTDENKERVLLARIEANNDFRMNGIHLSPSLSHNRKKWEDAKSMYLDLPIESRLEWVAIFNFHMIEFAKLANLATSKKAIEEALRPKDETVTVKKVPAAAATGAGPKPKKERVLLTEREKAVKAFMNAGMSKEQAIAFYEAGKEE